MKAAELFERLRLDRERFDVACEEAWKVYEGTRGYFRNRKWSDDSELAQSYREKYGSEIPDTSLLRKEVDRALGQMVLQDEKLSRRALTKNFANTAGLPDQVVYACPEGDVPLVHGVIDSSGEWVGWKTQRRDEFETDLLGIRFRAKFEFRPKWATEFQLGEDADGALGEVLEMIWPKQEVASRLELSGKLEEKDSEELESSRQKFVEGISELLGRPLVDYPRMVVWGTQERGLVQLTLSSLLGDRKEQNFFRLKLQSLQMIPSPTEFANRHLRVIEELLKECANQQSE